MLAALEAMKADLVYEYQERAGILEYDARQPRTEAETHAANMTHEPSGLLGVNKLFV